MTPQPNIAVPVRDVVSYLLELAYRNPGNDLTNLKLQKLLYYVQGTNYAYYNEPLFAEPIVKWQYGPVVPDVYHAFKAHGYNVIPESCITPYTLSSNQKEIIEITYNFFGQFSAVKLMNMTHEESPWNAVEMGEEMDKSVMKPFFDTIVEKE